MSSTMSVVKLTATEFRAQAAEAEAREAKQALALVEEAKRQCAARSFINSLSITPTPESERVPHGLMSDLAT
jgi:hypothetical protein